MGRAEAPAAPALTGAWTSHPLRRPTQRALIHDEDVSARFLDIAADRDDEPDLRIRKRMAVAVPRLALALQPVSCIA